MLCAMSDQPHAGPETTEDRIELSETFDRSAEVMTFEPSDEFVMPQAMGIDYIPGIDDIPQSSPAEDDES